MLLKTSPGRLESSYRAVPSYVEVWRYVNRCSFPRPKQSARSARPSPPQPRFLSSSSRRLNDGAVHPSPQKILEQYKSSISFAPATHEIKSLADDFPEGTEVVLHGYLGSRSDLSKKLSFTPLLSRDLDHSVQIISSAKSKDGTVSHAHANLKQAGAGTPVVVKGRLKTRPPAPDRPGSIGNGGSHQDDVTRMQRYEVQLASLEPLNALPRDLLITADAVYPPEQRHLHMRQNPTVRQALAFRARAARACRTCLEDAFGFTEIETPLLFKSTPEGAREFLVPTRRQGLAYALPQSPQQFKQVLMGSGISRYYQMARCFRDEDLRADRQPEFTQLDLEMSFAGGEEVMHVITTLVRRLWKDLLGIELPEQFQRLSYADAMATYGVDKPDTRFGMTLSRVDYLLPVDLVSKISPLNFPAVDAVVVRFDTPTSPSETRQFVSSFLDSPDAAQFHENPAGAPGIFIYDSSKPLSGLQPLGFEAAEVFEEKFALEDGDLLVLQARPDEPFSGGSIPLGNLRTAIHKEAVSQELISPPSGFSPLWVTDFPLFSPTAAAEAEAEAASYGGAEEEPGQGGTRGLASTHHPFTAPKTAADVDRLLTAPREVVGDHYDLVVNGVELGGGSRRIHDAGVQRLVMEHVLGMPPARVREFDHLLDVLRAGCPPHAGMALGFDRLVAVMLGRQSVRDVIAFPKSGSGEDALMRSPGSVSAERLSEYHLQLKDQ